MMTQSTTSQAPIGLIVPPAAGDIPPDADILYPHLKFIAHGLGLPQVTPAGYDQVIDRVTEVARQLSQLGAQAISLMGTSLSFYRGVEFNQQLQAGMEAATGKPCTTMSNAVLRGLEVLGVSRVVLATAYIDDVNRRLTQFLEHCGIEVAGGVGLALTDVATIHGVTTATLIDLCAQAMEQARDLDAIVLSCGGLQTLEAIPQVEARFGLPVVSSAPAGLWDIVRLAGYDARVKGYGRLLEMG